MREDPCVHAIVYAHANVFMCVFVGGGGRASVCVGVGGGACVCVCAGICGGGAYVCVGGGGGACVSVWGGGRGGMFVCMCVHDQRDRGLLPEQLKCMKAINNNMLSMSGALVY